MPVVEATVPNRFDDGFESQSELVDGKSEARRIVGVDRRQPH